MAIAYVQSVMAKTSAGSTATTGAITTTSGNLLVADLSYYPSFTSLTDSYGNTWSTSISEMAGSLYSGRQMYCANCVGGSGHTFTLTVPGSGYPTLSITEISSATTTSTLDKTATSTDNSNTHTTGNTATTSQANEMMTGFGFTGGGRHGAVTFAVSGSWIQSQNQGADGVYLSLLSAHLGVTSTGTYAFTWTDSDIASDDYWSGISTWKEATAAGLQYPQLERGIRGLNRGLTVGAN